MDLLFYFLFSVGISAEKKVCDHCLIRLTVPKIKWFDPLNIFHLLLLTVIDVVPFWYIFFLNCPFSSIPRAALYPNEPCDKCVWRCCHSTNPHSNSILFFFLKWITRTRCLFWVNENKCWSPYVRGCVWIHTSLSLWPIKARPVVLPENQ